MEIRGVLTEMSNERCRATLVDPVMSRINIINNFQDTLFSSPPSPDELIIQQRGRRNIPVIYKSNPKTASRFEDSPESESHNNVSSINLRSSARKRLLYDSQEASTSNEINSGSSNGKRMRIGQEVNLSEVDCIRSAMKALSPNQLIDLIGQIVNAHPDVEKEIRRNFPVPNLKPLEQDIKYLLRNINRGLTNPVLISKTNHVAYKMVSMHVFIFKKFVIDQGKYLIESRQWSVVMEYVFMAWKNVRKIPIWDIAAHNVARTQCFKGLASVCTIALENMKGSIDKQTSERYRKELNSMSHDNQESAEMCIQHLNHL